MVNRIPDLDSLQFVRESDSGEEDFVSTRGKDVLRRLVAQNPDIAAELKAADEELGHDPHYAAAMHTVAQSLRTERIEVFVSYRSERDAAAARAVKQVFSELSAGKVHTTIAEDFTLDISGKDYKEVIERSIGRAHWFVLLVSDHMADTDWCLFETGMFRGTMVSKTINRLICLQHPSTVLPDPIKEYQAVAATEEGIARWLKGLFLKPAPLPGWNPLNQHANDETILVASRRIAEAFASPREPIRLLPTARLTIPDSAPLESASDLEEARVATDQRTADLFGRTIPPQTWGELVQTVQGRNSTDRWLHELTAVLAKSRRHERSRPVAGTFESDMGGKVMRPVVQSIELHGGATTFEISFVEEITSAPTHRIPTQILSLLTAVRMNNRIRWEIVERFRNTEWERDEIDRCANVFSRIEREVASFGQWNLKLLATNFDSSVWPEVERIIERWKQLRAAGTSSQDYMTGELDRAFREGNDKELVGALFQEIVELNRDFLRLAQPAMAKVGWDVPAA